MNFGGEVVQMIHDNYELLLLVLMKLTINLAKTCWGGEEVPGHPLYESLIGDAKLLSTILILFIPKHQSIRTHGHNMSKTKENKQ